MTPSTDHDATPLEVLPPAFHRHATAAVGLLAKTVSTNESRALAGHPPVNCQLSGDQADALAAMVVGLSNLLGHRAPAPVEEPKANRREMALAGALEELIYDAAARGSHDGIVWDRAIDTLIAWKGACRA